MKPQGADGAVHGGGYSAPSITPPRERATPAQSCRSHPRAAAARTSAVLRWCSRVAHTQPLPGRTSATTASCLLARGRPVQVHPLGPQIIPRSRETRLGSLVDTMRQKRTGPRIVVKCKPAEQKGIQNVLRSPVIFRRVQWMWRLGSQSLICPTVQNPQDTHDSKPVCTL